MSDSRRADSGQWQHGSYSSIMGGDERKTSTARVWLAEDGILHVSSLGVESTENSVSELQAAKLDLVGKARVPMLFHGEDWPRGTPRSWANFVSIIESMSYAVAVVISPTSLRAMGTFPQLLDDLLIPFRVFESEELALAFLGEHQDS